MDKYKTLFTTSFKEYMNHCYGIYSSRKTHKCLLAMTHFHMINIAYQMLLDGLY